MWGRLGGFGSGAGRLRVVSPPFFRGASTNQVSRLARHLDERLEWLDEQNGKGNKNMTQHFEEVVPGIWTGPTEQIDAGNGDAVAVGTIWTDEDGVQVTVSTPEEGLIPGPIAGAVAAAIAKLGAVVPVAA